MNNAGHAAPLDRSAAAARPSLGSVLLLFLRLGLTSFGGPAAHIAMMETEVVHRRRWLTHEEFVDLVGATQLIPGPNSTELAIHLGWRQAGWPGWFAAGAAFILPSAILVGILAEAYVRLGTLPAFDGLLSGIKPVMLAVIAQAFWRLARNTLKAPKALGLGMTVVLLTVLGVHELALLAGAGIVSACVRNRNTTTAPAPRLLAIPPWGGPLLGLLGTGATPVPAGFTLLKLFAFFLKTGSILFGSGYVLLAFLRADLVHRRQWLTDRQLLDAIAVGQVTPGPVFTTATFIGYLLGGIPGAALATLGIFLPAFLFVALSGPLIPRLRQSPAAGAFLDGVNIASLALLATVTVQLAQTSLVTPLAGILGAASLAILVRTGCNPTWLILAGGSIGWWTATG